MAKDALLALAEAALQAERQFILTLGGFALSIPGAVLLTHEKIPAPRFNFVTEVGVGPERQTAFFERALDHYFQRAIRPTFRVANPPAPHVDLGLRRLGFRPREAPLGLLVEDPTAPAGASEGVEVRRAIATDLDQLVSFWTDPGERPELRTALDVAWHHPNPNEQLVPLIASIAGTAVAGAVLYRYGEAAGIHFVATQPTARGRGAASAVVGFARRERPTGAAPLSLFADSPRLETHLRQLGFVVARTFSVYDLPKDAELALPPPGPPGPPRWRPPR